MVQLLPVPEVVFIIKPFLCKIAVLCVVAVAKKRKKCEINRVDKISRFAEGIERYGIRTRIIDIKQANFRKDICPRMTPFIFMNGMVSEHES